MTAPSTAPPALVPVAQATAPNSVPEFWDEDSVTGADRIIKLANRDRFVDGEPPLSREEEDEIRQAAERTLAAIARGEKRAAEYEARNAAAPASPAPKAGPSTGMGPALLILAATAALMGSPARADDFHADAARQERVDGDAAGLLASGVARPESSKDVWTSHALRRLRACHTYIGTLVESRLANPEPAHAPASARRGEGGNGRPPP
jgi:hypothetical protein